MTPGAGVQLVDYTEDDLDLSIALETDPVVMAELGGPRPLEDIERAHATRVMPLADGGVWLKVFPPGAERAAGTIGVWRSTVDEREIWEAGWMLLPAHQGRGIAGAALAIMLERLRGESRFDAVHAFPGATNGPSNGLCRKSGFELVGEVDVEFSGRPMHCTHWVWRP